MNYYRTVTFQPPTETLTNFPILVRIKNDRMRNRIFSPQGWDVRFELDGNTLPFELDWYDAVSGSGAWWVQIPTLSSSEPTSIKMIYGDPSITSDQSDPATLWADYKCVYHFTDINDIRSSVGGYTATTNTGKYSWKLSIVENDYTGKGLRFAAEAGLYDDAAYLSFLPGMGPFEGGLMIIGSDGELPNNSEDGFFMRLRWDSPSDYYIRNGQWIAYHCGMTVTKTDLSTLGYTVEGTSTLGVMVVNGESQSASGRGYYNLPYGLAFRGTGDTNDPTAVVWDELRVSAKYHGSDWMVYEQNQIMKHDQYTTYGEELDSSGNPIFCFMPWLYQERSSVTFM